MIQSLSFVIIYLLLTSCSKQNNVNTKTNKNIDYSMNYYLGKLYSDNGIVLPFKMCSLTDKDKNTFVASFNNSRRLNLLWFDLVGVVDNTANQMSSTGSLYVSNTAEYFYKFTAKNKHDRLVGDLKFLQADYKVILNKAGTECSLDLLNQIVLKSPLSDNAKMSQGMYLGSSISGRDDVGKYYKICIKKNEIIGYNFFINMKTKEVESQYSIFSGYLNQKSNIISRGFMLNVPKKTSSQYQFSYLGPIEKESNNYSIMRLSESGEFIQMIHFKKTSDTCDKNSLNF
ncbi:MAG: hypothetical protein ACK5Z5_07565 [Neisseriaceae bacterium]